MAAKFYGMPINDTDALDVVIVQGKCGNSSSGKNSGGVNGRLVEAISNQQNGNGKISPAGTCRRHQCEHLKQEQRRQRRRRHNATQTPLATVGWQQLGDEGSCGGGLSGGRGICPSCLSICTMSSCMKHAHCFHHGEQNVSPGVGTGLVELTCHCHITHHCHQYSPNSGRGSDKHRQENKHQQQRANQHSATKSNRNYCNHRAAQQKDQHSHQRHHHHRHRHLHQHHHRHASPHYERHLPTATNFKSSFDSSAEQLCQQQTPQELCQEIAIEIDAATNTEENGSTATSNFAYKMAKENKDDCHHNYYGDKLLPYNCRRGSFNSNTTIETDELSRDDDDEDMVDDEQMEHNEDEELTPRRSSMRTENDSSITPRAICCAIGDDSEGEEREADNMASCSYGVTSPSDIHNENVRIKRKRFIANPHDYCSSCSSCSCARCDDNTSSCSSLDDDDEDNLVDYNAARAADGRPPYELTVSAECHHCNLPRQSSSASTNGEAVDDDEEADEQLAKIDNRAVSVRSGTASSTHTSRRSSESFCSCHSNSCYYCSCSCDECDTTSRMRTAREALSSAATAAPQQLEEQHSSTLTPLTNPSSLVSTPLADDAADVTIRSGTSNIFGSAICGGDDASSLSQSAEYFSISSSNQQSRATPTITPVHKPRPGVVVDKSNISNHAEHAQPPTKQCKHYSKHHRHKHVETTQDGYL